MKRLNKTVKNLEKVWDDLDMVCSYLEIAFTDLSMMSNVPNDVKDGIDKIDFSAIVSLKNSVEEMIDELKKDGK